MLLTEKRLQEEDIEDPLATQPQDPHSSQQGSDAACHSHSESSDIEQEQDFVSSVVSQRQGPRVHWGDLPKRTDEDKKGDGGKTERRKKQRREGGEEGHRSQGAEREGKTREDETREEIPSCKTEAGADAEKQQHLINTDKPNGDQVQEERGLPDEPCVEETTAKLNLYNLSETVVHTAVDSAATQAEHTDLRTSPPCKDSNSSTESKLPSSTLINTNQDGQDIAVTSEPGLNITQVGMSKRGAAGLRDLLRNHTAGAKPDSVRLNLLECLRRTVKDWSTDETLKFLYGPDHSLGSPFADVKEEKDQEDEEELDEDDIEDEVIDAEGVDAGMQKRPSAAAPDYKTLQQETQQLELRVREFYKGDWILPEEGEELHGNKVSGEKRERERRVVNEGPCFKSHRGTI